MFVKLCDRGGCITAINPAFTGRRFHQTRFCSSRCANLHQAWARTAWPTRRAWDEPSFTDADLARLVADEVHRGGIAFRPVPREVALTVNAPSNNVHHRRIRDQQLALIRQALARLRASRTEEVA